MFVRNSVSVDVKKYYCGDSLAQHLQSIGIPVFGREGGRNVFVVTESFKMALKNTPIYLKLVDNIYNGWR